MAYELTAEEREFLVGLAELTRRTGVAIGGCGCCGSPFLSEVEEIHETAGYGFGYADQVCWLDPTDDDYDWEEHGHTVVRRDDGRAG